MKLFRHLALFGFLLGGAYSYAAVVPHLNAEAENILKILESGAYIPLEKYEAYCKRLFEIKDRVRPEVKKRIIESDCSISLQAPGTSQIKKEIPQKLKETEVKPMKAEVIPPLQKEEITLHEAKKATVVFPVVSDEPIRGPAKPVNGDIAKKIGAVLEVKPRAAKKIELLRRFETQKLKETEVKPMKAIVTTPFQRRDVTLHEAKKATVVSPTVSDEPRRDLAKPASGNIAKEVGGVLKVRPRETKITEVYPVVSDEPRRDLARPVSGGIAKKIGRIVEVRPRETKITEVYPVVSDEPRRDLARPVSGGIAKEIGGVLEVRPRE